MGKGLFPDFGALFGAHTLKIEAWITPPAYTGSAPFVLTPGAVRQSAGRLGNHASASSAPAGPQISVMPIEGGAVHARIRSAGIDGAYEARVDRQASRCSIAVNFWGERASFPFTIIDDATPTVSFVEPPKLGDGDRTEFKYKLADDYGVDKLELIVRPHRHAEGRRRRSKTRARSKRSRLSPKEEEGDFQPGPRPPSLGRAST